MKSILILATLVAAAAITEASVSGQRGNCQQATNGASTCQKTQTAVKTQRRARSTVAVQGEQRTQPAAQRMGKGRRAQKGQRGQCGLQSSVQLLSGKATTTTAAAQVVPPIIRNYVKSLQATLEKELYARDYYLAADQALGGPPRFGNLASAEQNHADAVANMITYLGGTPVMSHSIPIVIPSTVAEADDTCRDIELLVIRVYKSLIVSCPDVVLLPTLNNIQAANYQHLSVVGG